MYYFVSLIHAHIFVNVKYNKNDTKPISGLLFLTAGVFNNTVGAKVCVLSGPESEDDKAALLNTDDGAGKKTITSMGRERKCKMDLMDPHWQVRCV